MGNRSRRELEGAAILRAMITHLQQEHQLPCCELCSEPAVIGAYLWYRKYYFCDAHRMEAAKVFDLRSGAKEGHLTS